MGSATEILPRSLYANSIWNAKVSTRASNLQSWRQTVSIRLVVRCSFCSQYWLRRPLQTATRFKTWKNILSSVTFLGFHVDCVLPFYFMEWNGSSRVDIGVQSCLVFTMLLVECSCVLNSDSDSTGLKLLPNFDVVQFGIGMEWCRTKSCALVTIMSDIQSTLHGPICRGKHSFGSAIVTLWIILALYCNSEFIKYPCTHYPQ